MRVIGGCYKGRKLFTLEGEKTRPTSDRAKESLFNIFQFQYDCRYFLDLFAGIGSIGIEALSRGSNFVVFVEENKEACFIIKKNLELLKVPQDRYTIICQKVEVFLKKKVSFSVKPLAFSVIFADPPYESSWYDESIEGVSQSSYIGEETLVVLERRASKPPYIRIQEGWVKKDERQYGTNCFEFWQKDVSCK